MTMRIHQMTATFVPGDAIGNYVLTLRRIFAELGVAGDIFADHVHPSLSHLWKPSSEYRPTGHDVLWFHYSIGADNFRYLENNPDRLVMDFHGVTPPHLIDGDDGTLARRAREAIQALPTYVHRFHLCVAHSDYACNELRAQGYARVKKIPLVVDTDRFNAKEDKVLSQLLARLEYMLFVGRIVPQKRVVDIVRTFAALKRLRPHMKLFLVGDTGVLPGYAHQVEALIRDLGLTSEVMLTGPIAQADMLTSLYQHAAVTLILSEWETFCLPAVESLYFGTPVVYPDIPPLREVVGDAGIRVQRERHAETAQAIHALLEDEASYKHLQALGRARAAQFTRQVLEERLRLLLPLITGA